MTTETETSIADQILRKLFTNGAGQQADRLLLVKDELHRYAATVSNAQYLGGYSRDAVRAILRDVLPRSNAEQLIELRKIAERALTYIETDPVRDERGTAIMQRLRAVLNPRQPEKETR